MVVALTRPTRITISQAAVTHNTQIVRDATHAKMIFLALKANAYGFGLIEMGHAAVNAGVDGIGVAVLDEALALREAGIEVPIMIMGLVPARYAQIMAENNIMATISDLTWLQTAKQHLAGTHPLLINVGVDTGMGRIGVRSREQLIELIDYLAQNQKWFTYQGIMTHFSEADSLDNDYFHYQLANWHALTDGLPMPPMVHMANSGAAMYHADEIPTEVVRVGTVLYGVEPSRGEVLPDDYLKPVLGLESELVFVKQMPANVGISYSHKYYTHEGEWIGTVPIGYGDGISRTLQGFEVLVNGQKAPIVGQIAMDQLMVSLPSEMPVGTKVTFIGKNGALENTLEAFSTHAGLAPWVITTSLQERIKRELID
ncbi:MAG: alanine racemase [Lactobacillaceae bacterium]|jgi:alanine racemase|nr:alanine racemase [Lactobacillaceae bacterium]